MSNANLLISHLLVVTKSKFILNKILTHKYTVIQLSNEVLKNESSTR